jgi:hypothetical protein
MPLTARSAATPNVRDAPNVPTNRLNMLNTNVRTMLNMPANVATRSVRHAKQLSAACKTAEWGMQNS